LKINPSLRKSHIYSNINATSTLELPHPYDYLPSCGTRLLWSAVAPAMVNQHAGLTGQFRRGSASIYHARIFPFILSRHISSESEPGLA